MSGIAALGTFFPFGSGLGTFPVVHRRFQPDAIAPFVNHVHKDYIEYGFEGGLVAAALILLFLVVYVRAWPRWGSLSFMQAGAGLGLLLMALHGLTDYNWHIPANAIYFALMAGVFLHRGETACEHAAPKSEAPAESAPVSVPVVRPNVSNPFAD